MAIAACITQSSVAAMRGSISVQKLALNRLESMGPVFLRKKSRARFSRGLVFKFRDGLRKMVGGEEDCERCPKAKLARRRTGSGLGARLSEPFCCKGTTGKGEEEKLAGGLEVIEVGVVIVVVVVVIGATENERARSLAFGPFLCSYPSHLRPVLVHL